MVATVSVKTDEL